MRKTTTKQEAELNLENIYQDMASCISFAYDHFVLSQDNAMKDSTSVMYGKRTRANIIYDAAVSKAKSLFILNDEIRMVNQRGIFFMIIKGMLIVRFKKLDKKKYSSNVKTKLATELNKQQNVSGIIDDLPLIELGYRFNPSETNLQDILFVYRKDAPLWSIPIYQGEITGEINFDSSDNTSKVVEKRIKLKTIYKEQQSGS